MTAPGGTDTALHQNPIEHSATLVAGGLVGTSRPIEENSKRSRLTTDH
jgi:hypothetical protein